MDTGIHARRLKTAGVAVQPRIALLGHPLLSDGLR